MRKTHWEGGIGHLSREARRPAEADNDDRGGGPGRVTRCCFGAGFRVPFRPSRQNLRDPLQMSITVYSKPACVQCTATTRALEAKGISFDVIDLTEDAAAMEMVQGLGYRQAPVVVAGQEHWAGFRPDLIGRLA